MKKYFFLVCVALALVCCGKETPTNEKEPEKEYSIVGVWESNDKFLSFSSDGFYCAYLNDNFIDAGTYNRDKDEIRCTVDYFNRSTSYKIQSISDNSIDVKYTYTGIDGIAHQDFISFKKRSLLPTSSSHALLNKTYQENTSYAGIVTYSFSTSSSGSRVASGGAAKNYPLRMFYIFLNDKVYMQYFTNSNGSNAIPSIGGWTTQADRGDVFIYKVSFSNTGGIQSFKSAK